MANGKTVDRVSFKRAAAAAPDVQVRGWVSPTKFLAQLPTAPWSALDVWTLPRGLTRLREEEHGAAVAAFARAHDPAACAAGSLGRRVPITRTEEAVACAALTLFFVLPFLPIAVFLFSLFAWARDARCVAAAVALALCLGWSPGVQTAAKENYVVRCVYKYFSYRLVFSAGNRFTADRTYIHVCGPHGVFPFGALMWQIAASMPGRHTPRCGVASVLLRLPVWRQVLMAFGCLPAARETLKGALEGGAHTGVAVDGIAGIFHDTAPERPSLLIKERRGVVRLAIKTGTPLLPCYFFTSQKPLELLGGNRVASLLSSLSRLLHVSLIVPTGRLGLPWPFLIPRRAEILGVIGTPVEVSKDENPSDADVDAKLGELCAAMVATFDAHKGAFGWGDKTLELL